jgi:hypothetical protein
MPAGGQRSVLRRRRYTSPARQWPRRTAQRHRRPGRDCRIAVGILVQGDDPDLRHGDAHRQRAAAGHARAAANGEDPAARIAIEPALVENYSDLANSAAASQPMGRPRVVSA